jgi:pimeloyl-ACP methyl ester carboxylesterase
MPTASTAPSTIPSAATTTAPRATAQPVSAQCPAGAASDLACFKVAVPVDPAAGGSTLDLAVTVRRATATAWNAPVLSILGTTPTYPWTDASAGNVFAGHDVIWIDQRGAGRSDGVTDCPDLAKFPAEIQTDNLGPDAVAAFKACFAKANAGPMPFASMFDHRVVASDIDTVRRALGINTWALYAGSAGADIALHLVDQDPASVSALVTRTPTAVGAGVSTNNIADAFDRFATDCAAVPSCAAKGDLHKLVTAAYARFATPVTTKVLEVGTGTPIVLDRHTLLAGVQGIGNTSIAPNVPSALAGGADGSSDEFVARAFASLPIDASAFGYVARCQQDDYSNPGLTHTANDHAGIFAEFTTKRFCDAVGPLPQYSARPHPTAKIPVLAVLPSYDPRGSVTTTKAIFDGFPNTTIIEVPRIVDPLSQLRDCFYTTANAFLGNPTAPLNATCLTAPALSTLK